MRYQVIRSKHDTFITPKIISLDTEYDNLNIRKAKLLSISIGVSADLTYILEDLSAVTQFIEEADIIFTWNGSVDWFMITTAGFEFNKGKILDAMLMEHLIDERLPHGLGDFALREYNDNYKEEFWKKYKTYQEASKEDSYEYEMRDGCYTFRAGVRYLETLASNFELITHVHRLQWCLFETEIKGIEVNKPLILKTKQEMGKKISGYLPKLKTEFKDAITVWELDKWTEEVNKRSTDKGKDGVARPNFSFASGQQVSWLVYQALEIPVEEKTKKGNPSTSSETLQKLSETHPELKTLVEYKQAKAVYSTFVEGMLDRVESDSRIYPGFYVNGTTTGRISHNNPNMGNLPTEGPIRNFFIPDSGNRIVGADYSQLEVVIEANLTEDKSLLKIILEGASKHDITSEGLKISRDQAKTLNFALQYGAGIHKVSKILGLSFKAAQDIFKRYWDLYSSVRAYKEKVEKDLKDKNEVTNIFGRTRHFSTPTNEFEASQQQRQAYNFMIQGPGADMMNMAAYYIADLAKQHNWGRLWFTVHDEAVAECDEYKVEQALQDITTAMSIPNNVLELKYPVGVKTYGPLPMWGKA